MADSITLSERQQVHFLLDALRDEQVTAVRGLLEVMVEPLSRTLVKASVEEEDLTSETVVALERARSSVERGECVSQDEVLREFGL